jgi:hypothetical protein
MPHHDMKDDIIICSISMMLMTIPIAGFNVNLDVPLRQVKFIYNNCIPKIRAVITISPSRVDYTDQLVFRGGQLLSHHLLPY